MKEKIKDHIKETTLRILAVSMGTIACSILFGIGNILITEKHNWFGLIPIWAGYELFRYVTIFLIKYEWSFLRNDN